MRHGLEKAFEENPALDALEDTEWHDDLDSILYSCSAASIDEKTRVKPCDAVLLEHAQIIALGRFEI